MISGINGSDSGIQVNPASAAQFILSAPVSVKSGAEFSLTLTVEDAQFTDFGVALQADGKVVAAGDGFVLVRYNPDGTLDGTFGTGGIVTTTFNGAAGGYFRNLAIQANGDIVAGGEVSNGTSTSLVVARFLPSEPQIGTLAASVNPVSAGRSLTLSASSIADGNPNSTITQVTFYYYDSSGNKVTLGTGTQTSPGVWTLRFTVTLAPGSYTLFAQAEDSYGVFGDPFATRLTVE